jgi:hypothetical protein
MKNEIKGKVERKNRESDIFRLNYRSASLPRRKKMLFRCQGASLFLRSTWANEHNVSEREGKEK